MKVFIVATEIKIGIYSKSWKPIPFRSVLFSKQIQILTEVSIFTLINLLQCVMSQYGSIISIESIGLFPCHWNLFSHVETNLSSTAWYVEYIEEHIHRIFLTLIHINALTLVVFNNFFDGQEFICNINTIDPITKYSKKKICILNN